MPRKMILAQGSLPGGALVPLSSSKISQRRATSAARCVRSALQVKPSPAVAAGAEKA